MLNTKKLVKHTKKRSLVCSENRRDSGFYKLLYCGLVCTGHTQMGVKGDIDHHNGGLFGQKCMELCLERNYKG